ncbi:hypothetical protein [Limosilactobacillus reuteri]|uniref:hypothetical protein n=1 Tax=Limosilactobacillus reuteri TaxID=1598 RepID=UPI00203E3510|nr:hypothetical protein [Limosilactobacillus reuteri]
MDSKTTGKLINNLEGKIEQASLDILGIKGLIALLDDTIEKIYGTEVLDVENFSELSEKERTLLAYGAYEEHQKIYAIWLALYNSVEELYKELQRKQEGD